MLIAANAELNAAGFGHDDVAVVCTEYVIIHTVFRSTAFNDLTCSNVHEPTVLTLMREATVYQSVTGMDCANGTSTLDTSVHMVSSY